MLWRAGIWSWLESADWESIHADVQPIVEPPSDTSLLTRAVLKQLLLGSS